MRQWTAAGGWQGFGSCGRVKAESECGSSSSRQVVGQACSFPSEVPVLLLHQTDDQLQQPTAGGRAQLCSAAHLVPATAGRSSAADCG